MEPRATVRLCPRTNSYVDPTNMLPSQKALIDAHLSLERITALKYLDRAHDESGSYECPRGDWGRTKRAPPLDPYLCHCYPRSQRISLGTIASFRDQPCFFACSGVHSLSYRHHLHVGFSAFKAVTASSHAHLTLQCRPLSICGTFKIAETR